MAKKFHITSYNDKGILQYGRLVAGARANAAFEQEVFRVVQSVFLCKVVMTTQEKGREVIIRSYEKE